MIEPAELVALGDQAFSRSTEGSGRIQDSEAQMLELEITDMPVAEAALEAEQRLFHAGAVLAEAKGRPSGSSPADLTCTEATNGSVAADHSVKPGGGAASAEDGTTTAAERVDRAKADDVLAAPGLDGKGSGPQPEGGPAKCHGDPLTPGSPPPGWALPSPATTKPSQPEPLVLSDVALAKLGGKRIGLVLALPALVRIPRLEELDTSQESEREGVGAGTGAKPDSSQGPEYAVKPELTGQECEWKANQAGSESTPEAQLAGHVASDVKPPFAMAAEAAAIPGGQANHIHAELASAHTLADTLNADLAVDMAAEVNGEVAAAAPSGADVASERGGEVALQEAAVDGQSLASHELRAALGSEEGPSSGPPGLPVNPKKRRRTREVTAEEELGVWAEGEVGARTLRQIARLTSYAEMAGEEGYGALSDNVPAGSRGRKKKQKLTPEADEREARIAAAIGFPRNALLEEEIDAGVVSTLGGVEQSCYIEARNHILATWRHNVGQWLHLDQMMETIRSQHRSVAASAFKFLVLHGYINFGVAPALRAALPSEPHKASVIIVGAGLAGLAAARQLLAFGHKVAVVEGRQRPGGRVYTKRMERDSHVAAADLGGSVITGADGNPLAVLARQLGFPLHNIRDTCPLYGTDGRLVDRELDDRVESEFNWMLDQASKWREEMDAVADHITLGTTLETIAEQAGIAPSPEERQLLNWHMANLEYANAALLSDTSFAKWDQDDVYEMSGDHCFLAGGNGRLVGALAEGLPLFLGLTVKEIKYGRQGVKVTAVKPGLGGGGGLEQVLEGDMVLCTVPLGVLKRDAIRFEPPLPQQKQEAIQRLGFGLLNKVAMLFPYAFWGDHLDTFGQVADDPARRGEFFLFYSYAAVAGGALLLGLVAGEAAHRFEEMRPEETVARVMAALRGIFEPQGVTVPPPMLTQCTRWKADPLAGGSYSYIKVGASGEDYDILAANVGGRLFFAGEATNRRYPATMHGALLSGLREAGKIAEVAAERAEPASRKSAAQKMTLQQSAAALDEIFQEPDVEFGAFSVVYDPRSAEPESQCLVRVTLRGEHEGKLERRQDGPKQSHETAGKRSLQSHPKPTQQQWQQNAAHQPIRLQTGLQTKERGYFTNLIYAQSRGAVSNGHSASGLRLPDIQRQRSAHMHHPLRQPPATAPTEDRKNSLHPRVQDGEQALPQNQDSRSLSNVPRRCSPSPMPQPHSHAHSQPQPQPQSGPPPEGGFSSHAELGNGGQARKETGPETEAAPMPRLEGQAKKRVHWKRRLAEDRPMVGKQRAYLKQTLQLYAVLSRTGAEQLREVEGGDRVRVFFLSEHLGVKLVGRRGLGPMGDELVGAIKFARAARQREAAAGSLHQPKLERASGSARGSGSGLGSRAKAGSSVKGVNEGSRLQRASPSGRLGTVLPGEGNLAGKFGKGEYEKMGPGVGTRGSFSKVSANGGSKDIRSAADSNGRRLWEAGEGVGAARR